MNEPWRRRQSRQAGADDEDRRCRHPFKRRFSLLLVTASVYSTLSPVDPAVVTTVITRILSAVIGGDRRFMRRGHATLAVASTTVFTNAPLLQGPLPTSLAIATPATVRVLGEAG